MDRKLEKKNVFIFNFVYVFFSLVCQETMESLYRRTTVKGDLRSNI